jgi:hypothetical protein
MRGRRAPVRRRQGFEKDLLAEEAHFIDELFQAAVLGNGAAKGLSLLLGKSDRDGLGVDFASPTPDAGMTLSDAALADQVQREELFLALLEARPKCRGFGSGNKLIFHANTLVSL